MTNIEIKQDLELSKDDLIFIVQKILHSVTMSDVDNCNIRFGKDTNGILTSITETSKKLD